MKEIDFSFGRWVAEFACSLEIHARMGIKMSFFQLLFLLSDVAIVT